jgi:hypothetical protein
MGNDCGLFSPLARTRVEDRSQLAIHPLLIAIVISAVIIAAQAFVATFLWGEIVMPKPFVSRVPKVDSGFNFGKGGIKPPIKDATVSTLIRQYEERAADEARRATLARGRRRSVERGPEEARLTVMLSGGARQRCLGENQWNQIPDFRTKNGLTSRTRVSKAFKQMDEIDNDDGLSSEDKKRERRTTAAGAVAEFDTSRGLARAHEAVSYFIASCRRNEQYVSSEITEPTLKSMKEAEQGWQRAMDKIAERAAQPKAPGGPRRGALISGLDGRGISAVTPHVAVEMYTQKKKPVSNRA